MRFVRSAAAAAALFAISTLVASCTEGITTKPESAAAVRVGPPRVMSATIPDVRVAELHYDNAGTDSGEAIEISAPISVDLTGWQIVLYNGSGGATYDTDAITAVMVAARTVCPGGTRQIVVMTYPVNGIQNGSPDGIAVVSPGGAVSEFLSYEGPFTATNGPANGTTSTDIGVSEIGEPLVGTPPAVQSLKRSGSNVWSAPSANSFGICNDHEEPPPPQPVDRIDVTPVDATVVIGGAQTFVARAFDATNTEITGVAFSWSSVNEAVAIVGTNGSATGVSVGTTEIRATAQGKTGTATIHVEDPDAEPPMGSVFISEFHYDNGGADTDEAIEVQGPAGISFSGWKIALYNQTGGAQYAVLNLPSDGYTSCEGRVITTVAAPGMQNGPADGLALISPKGTVFEFLSYEGTLTASNGLAVGRTSVDIGKLESGSEAAGRSLQKDVLGWYGPSRSTFGACNIPVPFVSMFGRDAGDPPLPVGFEFQLFAEYDNGRGEETPTTFTWISDNTNLLTVDQDGIVKATGIGSGGVIRAIAADGSVGTFTVPTQEATPSATARYGNNVEFGVPTDANPADDHIVEYPQYTLSYSGARNTPNWVSFNLEASHIGANRCDCFTFDQSLPPQFARYSTAHYVGSFDFYGFGYDRGHLLRSFDRAGVLDNARTFYLSNIIPQTSDNNQGPWSALEIHLGGLAEAQNKELYVIAGVAGNLGTLMNKGVVTIPEFVWKVALILPRDRGLADVHSVNDVELIAVMMPNRPGIRTVSWETYKTTVDAIEAESGYDLLKLLPDQIEIALESGTRAPVAAVDGPFSSNEGSAVAMSAAATTDPDANEVLSYSWNFGDGSPAGSGVTTSHTYAQNGTYPVTLTVTDKLGLTSTIATTANVTNVRPTITAFGGAASVLSGVPYTVSGAFTDPGVMDAPWTALVMWSDGAPTSTNLFNQAAIASATHTYLRAGTYTIRFTITDRDGGFDAREITVAVDRVPLTAQLEHERTQVRDNNGNHRLSFQILSSPTVDARTIVIASARIGSVGVAVKKNQTEPEASIADVNGDGRPDLVLDFYRDALVDAGLLTDGTRSLAMTADLTDGRQIIARAAVRPK